jgi:hypothetical protein
MAQQMSKDKLLDLIRVERRRLEDFLAELSQEDMVQSGVIGEWSVKDVLAHLVDWEQRCLNWIGVSFRGEAPETPAPGMTWKDVDILNQQIFAKHRNRTLEAVLEEFHSSYQAILKTVEGISEEDLTNPHRFGWRAGNPLWKLIASNTNNHYCWAKTEIQKWSEAQGIL